MRKPAIAASGRSVRRSNTSELTPSFSNSAAASRHRYSALPYVMKQRSPPSRRSAATNPKALGSRGIGGILGSLAAPYVIDRFRTGTLTAVVAAVGENLGLGVSIYLYFLAGVILVLGILSALFIPKFAGEIKTGGGFSLVEFGQALRNPVVWIAAVSLFFVYFFYTGVTYTTPYMTGVLGVSLAAATVVANIRNYGITLLSGPAFGWLANRFKPSVSIAIGSLVFIVALLAVMVALASATTLVAATMKLTAVSGSPDPNATGTVTTNYHWVDHEWVATTKYACKGLTPGAAYYLYGYSNAYWTPTVLIAWFIADAGGNAKGSATYIFPFDPQWVDNWDGYYVQDAFGRPVMMSH